MEKVTKPGVYLGVFRRLAGMCLFTLVKFSTSLVWTQFSGPRWFVGRDKFGLKVLIIEAYYLDAIDLVQLLYKKCKNMHQKMPSLRKYFVFIKSVAKRSLVYCYINCPGQHVEKSNHFSEWVAHAKLCLWPRHTFAGANICNSEWGANGFYTQ